MKITGIIRRMDDLGRVVIPKEIRRAIHLREGEPLEIFFDCDSVTFKKLKEHSVSEELTKFYNAYGNELSNAAQFLIKTAIKVMTEEEETEKTDEEE